TTYWPKILHPPHAGNLSASRRHVNRTGENANESGYRPPGAACGTRGSARRLAYGLVGSRARDRRAVPLRLAVRGSRCESALINAAVLEANPQCSIGPGYRRAKPLMRAPSV